MWPCLQKFRCTQGAKRSNNYLYYRISQTTWLIAQHMDIRLFAIKSPQLLCMELHTKIVSSSSCCIANSMLRLGEMFEYYFHDCY